MMFNSLLKVNDTVAYYKDIVKKPWYIHRFNTNFDQISFCQYYGNIISGILLIQKLQSDWLSLALQCLIHCRPLVSPTSRLMQILHFNWLCY